MLETFNASFVADEPAIFGTPNQKYIDAEILWYETQSLKVDVLFDIYGKEVKIWKDVACDDGYILSNYGWSIYSDENGNQYERVREELSTTPESRRALMIYQRPTMHQEYNLNEMSDFTCCNNVAYYIRDGKLHSYVSFRSNDAVFGYINDRAWMLHVQNKLAKDLNVEVGELHWHAFNLHVYPRHRKLIDELI